MRARPRVLLVAYVCSPDRGSEPGLGWNRARSLAQHCDVWVLCQDKPQYRAEIERHLQRRGPIRGLTFVFVPKPPSARWLSRIPPLYYAAYNAWHQHAREVARDLDQEIGFDVVHQVGYATFREPGYLWTLAPPFVWGPFGGAQTVPWRFYRELGPVGAARELARTAINACQLRFGSRLRRAARASALVLTSDTANQEKFERATGVTPLIYPCNGIPGLADERRVREGDDLRVLWCGALDPIKGLPLLLRALPDLPARRIQVRIAGDGPCRRRWTRLARALGVADRVTWLGAVPHADMPRHYEWADAFVFTALRDTLATVVLEAMAAGLPVVALEHAGVSEALTADAGILVPLTTPGRVSGALGAALDRLRRSSDERARLGAAARQRARRYLWSTQAADLATMYRRLPSAGSLPLAG